MDEELMMSAPEDEQRYTETIKMGNVMQMNAMEL